MFENNILKNLSDVLVYAGARWSTMPPRSSRPVSWIVEISIMKMMIKMIKMSIEQNLKMKIESLFPQNDIIYQSKIDIRPSSTYRSCMFLFVHPMWQQCCLTCLEFPEEFHFLLVNFQWSWFYIHLQLSISLYIHNLNEVFYVLLSK